MLEPAEGNGYLKLEDVKGYLRVEHDTEDALLERLILVSQEYLKGSVGEFCLEDPRAHQIALLTIADLYDNRSMEEDTKLSGTIRRIIQEFAMQMRLEHMRVSP